MTKKSNKIAALDTEYAKKKYAEFQQQQRQLIFRRRRLAAIFVGALVIFAIIGVQIYPILESNTDSSTNETDQSTSSTTAK